MRPTLHARGALQALLALLLATPAAAIDGVSVTAHWSGSNENLYGGFGQIVRHDIVNSEVTAHTDLYDNGSNPARNPVISPDGTRVAFLRQDGSIAVVPIGGGSATALSSAQSHGQACIDWPAGEWVYYTKGGFSQPSGSKLLHRVNATTNEDQYVTTFKKDDGTTDCGTWRFHIARDLQHAVVRPDDTAPEPAGSITAFDLVNDDRLRADRSIGGIGNYRCSTGMDPDGVYFIEGNQAHDGVTIRRWSDLSEVSTFRWVDTESWGPDMADTGTSHNRNAWAANSQDWILIHIGFGTRGSRGANQMMINWVDQERIVVSENADNSSQYDDAGDFYVTTSTPQAPQISGQPQSVTVDEGQTAQFEVIASGTAPLSYQWQRDSADIGGENSSTYSLQASPGDDGASFRCVVTNSVDSATSDAATLTVNYDASPPTVVSATAQGDPNRVVVLFNEPLAQAGAETAASYAIDQGVTISGAALGGDEVTVTLSTSAMTDGVSYTLTIDGVTDQATVPNTIAAGTTIGFTFEAVGPANQAPVVDAGEDGTVRVGGDLLIAGDASDDGLPGGGLTLAWSMTSGPGAVTFTPSDQASTFARFDTEGDYVLRFSADDGELSAFDEVGITVTPPASITITAPTGGETWTPGETRQIQWTTYDVADVRIDYSIDGGETWAMVEMTIDTSSPSWGDYGWVVPDTPSARAVVQLTEYSLITSTQTPPFTIAGAIPSLVLSAPVEGESYEAGSAIVLTWTAENASTVELSYKLDGGLIWTPIAAVSAGADEWGAYPWMVPYAATSQAEVRVRTPQGEAEDRSGPFTIVTPQIVNSDVQLGRGCACSVVARGFDTRGDLSLLALFLAVIGGWKMRRRR